ncbi:MAG TPA: helix-hairpin-helix domain-containing protein, partial [Vicinamibacterales bacterium]|nr:helix-hairpin-helix domain-containing protein [Vicinamibacterales bacterium]
RRAASVRLTREGWAAVIDGMIKRGAKVPDDEFPIILDYLSTHFLGEAAQPLNLNTAQQIDLESAGGLLRREAAAVIRYREKHGRFNSLDDLKKVPGLDFKKIDSRREFMTVM